MSQKEIELLKRSLERQKRARQQAEKILEQKSKELYDTTERLQETNERLENLVSEKTSELEGVFINIVDPYVVMDLRGTVIKMNQAAIDLLGFDSKNEQINLNRIVHPDFLNYTRASFKRLYEVGTIKMYQAKIITKQKEEKLIQVNASIIKNKEGIPIAAQGIVRDITREEEIKELLAEQKKQLDTIVENSPLGIVLTTNDYIIKSNKTFAHYLGYSEEELLGKKFSDFIRHKNQNKDNKARFIPLYGKAEQFTEIQNFVTKDGSSLTARLSSSVVRDSLGKVKYKVTLVEDITQQIEAENKIKETQSRLASLVSNLHLGILLEDEKGKVALCNPMLSTIFDTQMCPDQFKNKKVELADAFMDGLMLNAEKVQELRKELRHKKQIALEREFELKSGHIIQLDYIPIFTDGLFSGQLWIFNDVTERNNYNKSLEIQKEKYSSIIANMNLGLLEVDLDEKILLVNKRFCELSGYSSEELMGKKAVDLIEIENKETLVNKTNSRKKHVSDSYEIQVKNKKGELRYWLISGAPRYNELGQVIGSIGIHLDITDQKQLELQKEQLLKKLEASNVNLREYAHIVSHDLKSPLRGLNALLSWTKEDYADKLDEQGLENFALMEEKIEAMDKLINGVLEYSSIQSETLKENEVNLNEVINEIREIIYVPDHIEIKVIGTLPTIIADKTRIHQLFQNIITNAVNYIDKPKGLVEVACRDSGDVWTFRIKDNGVGIPEEYHQKVFDIFQTIGDKEDSTGIGLSIVKKIVELYNGEICLDSKEGEGTEFYFTIKKS